MLRNPRRGRGSAPTAEQHSKSLAGTFLDAIRLRSGASLHLAVAAEIGAKTIATLDNTMLKTAKRLKMVAVRF